MRLNGVDNVNPPEPAGPFFYYRILLRVKKREKNTNIRHSKARQKTNNLKKKKKLYFRNILLAVISSSYNLNFSVHDIHLSIFIAKIKQQKKINKQTLIQNIIQSLNQKKKI